jgi:hypothetical protein
MAADPLEDETVERAMVGVIVALETPATEPPPTPPEVFRKAAERG